MNMFPTSFKHKGKEYVASNISYVDDKTPANILNCNGCAFYDMSSGWPAVDCRMMPDCYGREEPSRWWSLVWKEKE
jgi:hypothetical protein